MRNWVCHSHPASDTVLKDEYIGRLMVPRTNGGAYTRLQSMFQMTKSLLLASWIDISKIVAPFRYVSGYVDPDKSTGNATLCHISNSVNISHYELIYRCEGCWSWDQGDPTAAQDPARQCSTTHWMGTSNNTPAHRSEHDYSLSHEDHSSKQDLGLDRCWCWCWRHTN